MLNPLASIENRPPRAKLLIVLPEMRPAQRASRNPSPPPRMTRQSRSSRSWTSLISIRPLPCGICSPCPSITRFSSVMRWLGPAVIEPDTASRERPLTPMRCVPSGKFRLPICVVPGGNRNGSPSSADLAMPFWTAAMLTLEAAHADPAPANGALSVVPKKVRRLSMQNPAPARQAQAWAFKFHAQCICISLAQTC